MGRAVLAQGALARALAPATLEIWVSLEAQPTALTHGPALVEVNCGRQGQEALWDGDGLRMATGKLWVPIWSQPSFHQAPVTLSHLWEPPQCRSPGQECQGNVNGEELGLRRKDSKPEGD